MVLENQIMDFELLEPAHGNQYESDLVIYFVLNGKLTIASAGGNLTLEENDFAIINPFQPHSLDMKDSPLAMRFSVNLGVVTDYYDVSKMDFFGNSVEEESERHIALRNLMKKCIAYYYGKRSGEGRILLKLNSFYYEIAEILISSFSVVENEQLKKGSQEYDEALIREMTRYIHLNYKFPLKLEDVAERVYLSPAYASRYFKKKMGINFAKYLTEIRLIEAVKEMEDTQKSLTHIAMDCGFPNLASFNKAFREKYNVNPKHYRDSRLQSQEAERFAYGNTNPAEIQLLDYLEKSENIIEDEFAEIDSIEVETSSYAILTKTWNRLINIGSVSMLLQKVIQDHTVFLCKSLGFEYVRVWDLYEPGMHISAGNKNRRFNFSRLDMCLDFLTENHLKLYLELGFKPFILLKDYEEYTFHEEREILFEKPEDYGVFISHMLRHLLNRYGRQEVSTWIFEVWCDPRWFRGGDASEYIDYFEQAYQAIKELSPLSKVGGDYDRSYDVIDFEAFIRKWSARNIQPDFLSLYCYEPNYADEFKEKEVSLKEQKDFGLEYYLESRKNTLMKYGMMMPIYSSEWNFTVINANVLNDSRFKGAYIMKTIMDTYEKMDLWGYWFGTDLFVEDDDAPMLLNGRCGLITHQRICKPAYWAMRFMNHLGNYLLKKTSNAMVTMDDFDNYVIVCHNYKELDIPYYTQKEREVMIESIPYLFKNNKRRIVKIKITGIQNGLYHIKTRVINSQYGCVQDEWIKMNKVAYLTTADVEYINHISRPHIMIAEQIVTDHTLHLTAELEPQEMQLIHAFQYIDGNREQ